MDTRRPDPAVARGGGTRWGVPPAEGGGVAAASCLVNHDGELGPRKTEKLPYPHCPKAQTPRGAISCSEFPWDQELEEEKTPQGSPHPQGIPFAGGGAETQLSGFHFSVPEMAFLFKKKKKKRKEGREGGRREISVTAAPLGPAPGVGRASAQGWGHASLPARVGRGQPQGPAIKPTEGHWQPLELAQLVASARRGGGDRLERRVAGGPSCKQSPWGYFQALFPVRKEWEECSPAVTQIPPP